MTESWRTFEHHIRAIAQLKWKAPCKAEHIDGIDFDGVVRISPSELVLIEMSEERTLDKVRSLINRLSPVRLQFATTGVICRCYIVLSEPPTNSMIEAGRATHIEVLSAQQFEQTFFNFSEYNTLREKLPFGSAVDSKTGENDNREFIQVRYESTDSPNGLTLDRITQRLTRGARVVLTGDFGVGKSRCIREVYRSLTSQIQEAGGFPLAINLRDHWSSSTALEMLAGHLGNVGLSSSIDNVIQLLNNGNLILLLDGFDEIGTQSHDTRIDDRRALRRRAVRAIRDLVEKSSAGVLISGRSHFFDSDEEMLDAMGLSSLSRAPTLASIPDNFSTNEGQQYLEAIGVEIEVPEWLPRKPLVFQILAELDQDQVTSLLRKPHADHLFWRAFIDAACERESKGVGGSISPITIVQILIELATKTRYSHDFLGRLSPRDIDDAYEIVIGSAPDETGRQLLARMCTLGRIEPASPDRQFIDAHIVDILRADGLISDAIAMHGDLMEPKFLQPLRSDGMIYAATMASYFDLRPFCYQYLRKFGSGHNTYRNAELVSMLTLFGPRSVDFESLEVAHAHIPVLDLREREAQNLVVKDSIIDTLLVEGTRTTAESGCELRGCIVEQAIGISGQAAIPSWIVNCDVLSYEDLNNSARIKEAPIAPSHKLFLVIVHKIFFQRGSGREEAALLKGGYGQEYDSKSVNKVLRLLLREGIIDRFKGKDGWVYTPVRKHTARMDKMRSQLSLSEDPIWEAVGKI